MKRTLLSALTILVASAAVAPVASALEPASLSFQSQRLEAFDARHKNAVHKLRIEHLNNQSKAIENIQAARLNGLDVRQKAVKNIQAARLDGLDSRQKNAVHKLRLASLDSPSNAVENIQSEHLDVDTKFVR